MSSSKMTLFGLSNYNSSLFDGLSNLPSDVDTDQLEKNILLRGGEFEVLYPDPDFCQEAIESWAIKWTPTIQKWVDALAIEYDPLYNYDRYESYTDTENATSSLSSTGSMNGASSGTSSGETQSTGANTTTGQSASSTSDSGTDTTENTVSAYDSNSYQPHDKDTVTYGKGTSGSTTTSGTVSSSDNITTSGSDSRTDYRNDTRNDNRMDAKSITHEARLYGNIGVTTTQEMLRSELEIARFNLLDQITDLFLTEFVIPVYY